MVKTTRRRAASIAAAVTIGAALAAAPAGATINVPGDEPTIQAGINAATTGETVAVAAGTYAEDVVVNKQVTLQGAGAGAGGSSIVGPLGGGSITVQIAASGVVVDGFTITRAGNNTTDWNNLVTPPNTAGVAVQGAAGTGFEVRNNRITGNRTGIDVNNTSGGNIHDNDIVDNRTGLIFRNQTDNVTIADNAITGNWTVGVVFLDGSGGTNSPFQRANGSSFESNNITGNWYGQIVDRQTGGSLPTPGTTSLKDFGSNWLGSTSPTVTSANSAEPGYDVQIPVAFGGTATPPATPPADILGAASANVDYTPLLPSGTDTSAAIGFQPSLATVLVHTAGPQSGSVGRVEEGADDVATDGTVDVAAGTYTEHAEITENVTIDGAGDSTIIKSPATLTNTFAVGSFATNKPIVWVHDVANTTIRDLKIDGDAKSAGNERFMGIAFQKAGGRVENVTVVGMRHAPLNGNQSGLGIYATNASGTSTRVLTVADSRVSDYQKGGITMNGPDLVANVVRNTVTGAGPTDQIAQNGIQYSRASGTIADNTVTGNACDHSSCGPDPLFDTQSGGLLILDIPADRTVRAHDNTVSGNDIGIFDSSIPVTGNGSKVYSDNTLTNNRRAGIWVDEGNATITGNKISGGAAAGILAVSWDNGASEDWVPQVDADGNTITGTQRGIELIRENDTTTPPDLSASFNRIVGNTVGVANNARGPVDAQNNWWGCNGGPGTTGCDTVGGPNVDATPWLVVSAVASPASIYTGNGQSVVTASLRRNSAGQIPAGNTFPQGTTVGFATTLGALSAATDGTDEGTARSTLNAGATTGSALVTVSLDNGSAIAPVQIVTAPTGADGAQGDKGDKGDTGNPGGTGPKGDTGSNGADGGTGPKGDTGAQGPQGPTGPTTPSQTRDSAVASLATKSVRVKNGRIALSVRCVATGLTRCTGTLAFKLAGKSAGSVKYSIPAGSRGSVTLKVTKATLTALAGGKSVTLTATATTSQGDRGPSTSTKSLKVLPPKSR